MLYLAIMIISISLSTRGCNEDVIFFDHDYDCFVQPYSC